ncbi:glycoside hydrolase family 43 protein [Hypoxylon rubiginosum]|uniref:Glycoside hydrolase family 43 protein n=1 Tax=Hypoxylon rubiginosum TaxID=110542 RepID=A0ACC0D3P8_9PEZI|nr:glycoside hydrolase family 43 protein [Hypoxylon rubiginosum]
MKFLSFLSLAAGVSAATLQQQSHEKRSDTEIAARAVDKPYVFATFTSKNEQKSNEETWLHIYTSDDGKQFAEYAMNAYKPSKSLLRDPSIIKDGDTYYIAHTTGWDGDDFAVIKSKDLKNWENVATVKTGVKDTEKTWAPEWFKDPKDGQVYIYVSIKTKQEEFAPYIFTAKGGLTSFGAGEKLDVYNYGSGVGQPHIDMFIVHKADDKETPYHAFMKNEKEKHIEHLTSKSAKGTWNYVQTNNALGFGNREGPAVTKLPDDKWIMWMDNYHGNYLYSTSDDLSKWSDSVDMPSWNKKFRHGTVIRQ